MKLAIIFNGQGAHYQNMGMDFVDQFKEAQEVFDTAESVTQYPLRDWIKNDPDQFAKTRYAQPAISAVSLAIYRSIASRLPAVDMMAGLSLGEYSALIASEMLSLADGFQLLKERGEIMSQVSEQLAEESQPQMLAVMNMPFDEIEELVRAISADSALYIANMNSHTQTILAGSKEAVEAFRKEAKERGYKRVMPLKVEGPFHSPLMRAVVEPLKDVLTETTFHEGKVPVISNVTVEPLNPSNVRQDLLDHITQPVHWRQTIDQMVAEGYTHIIQIGPGNTLQKLIERDAIPVEVLLIDRVEDIDALSAFIGG